MVEPRGRNRSLPRRFYTAVAVEPREAGFAILLDGKAARTPGKALLLAGARPLAEAMAAEWARQEGVIDPRTMPITRLINSSIDHVGARLSEVRADIAKYAGSDLICYRAEGPEALVQRQRAAWDPVLVWAERRLGHRLVVTEGVMPVEQCPEAVLAVGRALETYGVTETAALHVSTTTLGSAVMALALAERALTAEEAWSAAHIDEDWQIEQWGHDAEATARRAYRKSEFDAAAFVLGERARPQP
jgi:chaperone required for assembly of F1-ATPase